MQRAAATLEQLLAAAGRDRDQVERLLSIDEAAKVLGIGRTRLYAEIAAHRLTSVHAGRRHLVPTSAIAAYASRWGDARQA
jgi:excisionase family DNA binding protein